MHHYQVFLSQSVFQDAERTFGTGKDSFLSKYNVNEAVFGDLVAARFNFTFSFWQAEKDFIETARRCLKNVSAVETAVRQETKDRKTDGVQGMRATLAKRKADEQLHQFMLELIENDKLWPTSARQVRIYQLRSFYFIIFSQA